MGREMQGEGAKLLKKFRSLPLSLTSKPSRRKGKSGKGEIFHF